jgi:hypothetical protein
MRSVRWYISRETCPECPAGPYEPCALNRGTFHHERVEAGTKAFSADYRRKYVITK